MMNMKKTKEIIPTSNEIISLQELKLLVTSIIRGKARIRIKCLMDGGVWAQQFSNIIMLTERGLVLTDDANDKIKSVRFKDHVVQFVLDRPFESYDSNLAYKVR